MGDTAQFVIDIAAKLDGGDATVAQLDAITAKLSGVGKGSTVFRDALAQVTSQLNGAKAASASANSALSAGTEVYRALEKSANQAAKAAEKAALKNEGVVPGDLAAKAMAAAVALGNQAERVRALEKAAKGAESAEAGLTTRLASVQKLSGHVDKSFAEAAERTSKLRGALANLGGPIGALGQRVGSPVQGFRDLSSVLGSSKAAMVVVSVGAVAAAAAVTALGLAAVVAVAKVATWAAGLADTQRDTALVIEATEVLDPKLESLHRTIDELTDETGLSELAIDKLAASLEDAHVSAKDMPVALQAAAEAEAALGQGGAQKFISAMQSSRKSVREFAAETSAKLSGVVSQRLLSLDSQAATLKGNIASLFGGLKIDPLLHGMQRVVALFDETTASGKAIKFLFDSVFQPIIDGADAASVEIEAFALGFEIGLVKLYIALKPTIRQVRDLFGIGDMTSVNTLDALKTAGEAVAGVFRIAAVPIADFVDGLHMIGAAVFAFDDAFANIEAKLRAIDLGPLGTAIMHGLIDGVEAAGGAVVDSVLAPVRGSIAAAKHLLGIASPSKVFAAIGENTALGFAAGVDRAAPDAQSAVTELVSAPAPAPRAVTVSAPASAPSPLAGAVFNFYGVKDAEHAAELVTEAITRVLEGDAAAFAGAPA